MLNISHVFSCLYYICQCWYLSWDESEVQWALSRWAAMIKIKLVMLVTIKMTMVMTAMIKIKMVMMVTIKMMMVAAMQSWDESGVQRAAGWGNFGNWRAEQQRDKGGREREGFIFIFKLLLTGLKGWTVGVRIECFHKLGVLTVFEHFAPYIQPLFQVGRN